MDSDMILATCEFSNDMKACMPLIIDGMGHEGFGLGEDSERKSK
jgi:hypothetical protein